MKIFFINLDRSEDRLGFILNQFAESHLRENLVRWPGIDGSKDALDQYYTQVDQTKSNKLKGRDLTTGQIGCYASHYEIWNRVLENNEAAIILEDDIDIEINRLEDFVSCCQDLSENIECLRLFPNSTKRAKKITVDSCYYFSISKHTRGPMGAQGYYLTPKGAEKFLNSSTSWFLPVDLYMDAFWIHKVDCYGIDPPILKHSGFSGTRTGTANRQLRPKARIRKEFLALVTSSKRFWHNFKFYLAHLRDWWMS